MKKLIRHVKRWNYWRKRNCNSKLHKLLVLFGLVVSPTFHLTILPEDLFNYHNCFLDTSVPGQITIIPKEVSNAKTYAKDKLS